jgi:hypothetical protein
MEPIGYCTLVAFLDNIPDKGADFVDIVEFILKEPGMNIAKSFRLKTLILISAACLVLIGIEAPGVSAQDITLHESTTAAGMPGAAGNRNSTQTRYISSKAMKNTSSTGQDTIILLTEGKIIHIDNNKKTYSEMTVQQLNEMLAKMSAGQGKEENAKAMAAMREMMGQVATSISVTKVSAGENIAGYATEKYQVTGPMAMEIWAAPALKMPALYYDAMKVFMPKNPMFDMGKLYDEMKKIQGIPLKTVTTMKMMNTEMKTTAVVTSVDKTPIPASVFQVPAGYKLVQNKF